MTEIGDRVECPQCGETARVVWISRDEKTVAIGCNGYHSQIGPPFRQVQFTWPEYDEEGNGVPCGNKCTSEVATG